jgi:hypothetical protein
LSTGKNAPVFGAFLGLISKIWSDIPFDLFEFQVLFELGFCFAEDVERGEALRAEVSKDAVFGVLLRERFLEEGDRDGVLGFLREFLQMVEEERARRGFIAGFDKLRETFKEFI